MADIEAWSDRLPPPEKSWLTALSRTSMSGATSSPVARFEEDPGLLSILIGRRLLQERLVGMDEGDRVDTDDEELIDRERRADGVVGQQRVGELLECTTFPENTPSGVERGWPGAPVHRPVGAPGSAYRNWMQMFLLSSPISARFSPWSSMRP